MLQACGGEWEGRLQLLPHGGCPLFKLKLSLPLLALRAGLVGELTEQLRLILEPTLASRLAGDYRSGKRINMKKVRGWQSVGKVLMRKMHSEP